MSNHITWSEDAEEPCLDIDVTLEVTLEVCFAFTTRLQGFLYSFFFQVSIREYMKLIVR